MEMKLAIGLFGIHYINEFHHWLKGLSVVNYKDSVENNITFFKNYLSKDTDLTFFGSTYFSDKLIELIDDYKFKSLKLTNVYNSDDVDWVINRRERNRRFKEVINLILNDDNEYDFVLLTRFDIFLKDKIYEFKLDLEKVNILYDADDWENGISFIDDNFYLLPYKNLRNFYNQICFIDEKISSHHFHHHIGIDNFNVLTHGIVDVHKDETREILYNLMRK